MFSVSSSDAASCAAGCVATSGCTGFEVGSDSGPTYGDAPYCALWLNGACTVPDENFAGAFSIATGAYIEVDTYTLTLPLDAFTEYEHMGCLWAQFRQGEDWDFADKTSADAESCAKTCLDRADASLGGCTGFEVGTAATSASSVYGDLSSGYCALWFNSSCTPDEFLSQATSSASTYILLGADPDDGCGSSLMFYAFMLLLSMLLCIGACCCCRAAMVRRRLMMQQRLALVAAARAAPGAEPSAAAVVVTSHSTTVGAPRAVVYAVRIEDSANDQQEPVKQ
jgi:hypothetical protein